MTWIIGFFVSIVVGHGVVWTVRYFLYKHLNVVERKGSGVMPGWMLGAGERAFFTLVIAFNIAGAAISMIAWVALKMATGWNRLGIATKGDEDLRTQQALGALFVNLWSMGFALIGGVICNDRIPITWFTEYFAWLGGGSGN